MRRNVNTYMYMRTEDLPERSDDIVLVTRTTYRYLLIDGIVRNNVALRNEVLDSYSRR